MCFLLSLRVMIHVTCLTPELVRLNWQLRVRVLEVSKESLGQGWVWRESLPVFAGIIFAIKCEHFYACGETVKLPASMRFKGSMERIKYNQYNNQLTGLWSAIAWNLVPWCHCWYFQSVGSECAGSPFVDALVVHVRLLFFLPLKLAITAFTYARSSIIRKPITKCQISW